MAITKLSGVTKYDKKEHYYSPTGDGWETEFGYDVDDKGRRVLVIQGKKNLYAEIQSYQESCKIENILKRVAVGDMSDFRPNGIYADTTNMPKNLIEARKAMVHLENTWNKLPKEVKEKYNNSVEEFIGEAGSEAWLQDMGLVDPKAAEPTPTIEDTIPNTKVETPNVE